MTRERWLDPGNWASLKPFGIGEEHPNNYLELWNAFKENRDQARYAWRILTQGTCDGCALGTKGMRDWTTRQVHLCNVRLRLLRLNTMPALDTALLADVPPLAGRRSAELRDLGRLPYPMVRRRGEPGFTRTGWDDALDLIAERIRASTPDRLGVYLTSRGTPNETYFAAQKAVRAMGTNSVDNAARVCHSPSTFGLKGALGVAATTCSYTDWIGSDLIVFVGANVANNQPVAMKYLYHAKKAGTKVAVVNPYREPGMERYWVPSNVESAVFGTKIADRYFLINVGGDIGFLNGALKHMIERGFLDRGFIEDHTEGFDQLAQAVNGQSWEELEALAGAPRSEMEEFAAMLGKARTAVLVWSMGVTQHEYGEDNVRAIINLGLTKGFVGRDKCGLMPIRGHSGVQGGAEMGAYATVLPGGLPIDEANAARFSALWGFEVPATTGMTAPEMLDAADEGRLEVLVSSGGNFLEVLPDPEWCRRALGRVPLRVHADIMLSSQMLVDPADTVVLLPAATRYEIPGGVTETSTERRVIFSPEVPGPRIGEARPEWQVFVELATRPPRAGRAAPLPGHRRHPRRHRPRDPRLRRHPTPGQVRRPVPVRRLAPVRRLEVPHRRRQGALLGGAATEPRPAGGHVQGRDQAWQAVQQHGPRAGRPLQPGGSRGGPGQPRRRRAARPRQRRPGGAAQRCRRVPRPGPPRPGRPRQPPGPLARGPGAHRPSAPLAAGGHPRL